MTVLPKDLLKLETELASLFIDNPKTTDLRFIQSLVQLVRTQPSIMEFASSIPPSESGKSFILLLLDRVFNYSLTYAHPSYKPYFPQSSQESALVDQVLKTHFSDLRPQLTGLFQSLGSESPAIDLGALKSSIKSSIRTPKKKEEIPKKEHPKKLIKHHTHLLEDPGIQEEALQFLWVPSATERFEFPEELKTSYPNWAKGVIASMQRSLKLFSDFKKARQHAKMTANEIRVQPHHKMVRILLGTEFYWLFNKREVDLGRSIPNKRIMELIQGFLYSLNDLFLSVYSPDHPIHQELTPEMRTNWRFERVRGIRGAPKVLSAYEDNNSEYLVECTGLSINLKKHVVRKLMNRDGSVEKGDEELLSKKPLPIVEHPDHGIDEDILWKLYTNRRTKQQNVEEEVWPESFSSQYPLWARGIISNMRASLTLYHDFKRSRYRTKSFDTIHIQPHHQMIWILVAAEYYWLFNMREVQTPESLGKVQLQELMNSHMYDIAEEFRLLLPVEHCAIKGVSRDETEVWRTERLRGAGGAPQVTCKISLPKQKEYLVQCTASVISIKALQSDEPLIEISEERGKGNKDSQFIDETDENPLPVTEYNDPGVDQHMLWMLYAKKERKRVGWEDHVSDSYPLWAQGIIRAMEASQTLYDEFHLNKRRYKRFESKRLQPNHKLVKFLLAAEYFWLFNFREVEVPKELGYQEVSEMHQGFLYDIQGVFIDLLPAKHPIRQQKRTEWQNWKADRIRGSSGASKVIVRLMEGSDEYLLEMTTSMVAVRKIIEKKTESIVKK